MSLLWLIPFASITIGVTIVADRDDDCPHLLRFRGNHLGCEFCGHVVGADHHATAGAP